MNPNSANSPPWCLLRDIGTRHKTCKAREHKTLKYAKPNQCPGEKDMWAGGDLYKPIPYEQTVVQFAHVVKCTA